MKTIKFAILKNEDPFDHLLWINAFKNLKKSTINYRVIDITTENWLKSVNEYSPDILLLKPSGKTSLYRTLYQERLEILTDYLHIPSFPSIKEVRIYENKRFFAYWAQANKIPHPKTWVFYNIHEAISATENFDFPLVAKMNIGASGNGIHILRTRTEFRKYIKRAFKQGVRARTGPKLGKGNLIRRLYDKMLVPSKLLNRLKTYRDITNDKQKGFIILQQYIKHDYEWRAVRIGESYFAHKKIVFHGKASGSLVKKYENPSPALLNFVRAITNQFGFKCVAIDFFEPDNEVFLINEIQCIFGQSDPHQMIIDGKPGRYLYQDGKWVFEEGNFNSNESFDLRLKTALQLFESGDL